jgi:SpoU rRNA methylase family enzyme
MSDEDREWGEINLNQRAMEAGWKYWALVVPEQVVAAGSMVPTIQALYEYGLRMMVFSNLEEAFNWLDSFPD